MHKEWVLTKEAFDRLLDWLGHDREVAGRKYETIRRRLIEIFTCRGCREAEDLADETINRVTLRLPDIIGPYEGDPARYFYGVAQKVYLESLRAKPRQLPVPATSDGDDEERELECLDECMSRQPPPARALIERYYDEGAIRNRDRRLLMAREMGISSAALRLRAHRVREALRQCVEECLGRAAEKQT